MPGNENTWQGLFAGHGGRGRAERVEMRGLKKGGRFFLLVPTRSRAAAACLELYPAQSSKARAVRKILRGFFRAGIPLGTKKGCLELATEDPFVKFLASVSGIEFGGIPLFGILAGNPWTEGQRFLLLLFDTEENPIAIVKAATTDAAKVLIEKERSFLASAAQEIAGMPRLRGEFASAGVSGFAMDFCQGDSPRPENEVAVGPLLTAWIDQKRTIALEEMKPWQNLRSVVPGQLSATGKRAIHPAIQHGDFVPWNIKVSPAGEWKVLDWERGELCGIPGWDWFHYVIQQAILVRRERTEDLIELVEGLLKNNGFRNYAQHARIEGVERQLMIAYLANMIHVIKPSEGFAKNEQLLAALTRRWSMG